MCHAFITFFRRNVFDIFYASGKLVCSRCNKFCKKKLVLCNIFSLYSMYIIQVTYFVTSNMLINFNYLILAWVSRKLLLKYHVKYFLFLAQQVLEKSCWLTPGGNDTCFDDPKDSNVGVCWCHTDLCNSASSWKSSSLSWIFRIIAWISFPALLIPRSGGIGRLLS